MSRLTKEEEYLIDDSNEEKSEVLDKRLRDAINAYSQLPFLNALLFGFTAATSSPCRECQYQIVQDLIIILLSCSMILSLGGLCISILTIYHAYKLLAEEDPEVTRIYLLKSTSFRDVARGSTFCSFFTFILSFALCPIFTYSFEVSFGLALIFVVGTLWVLYSFFGLIHIFSVSKESQTKNMRNFSAPPNFSAPRGIPPSIVPQLTVQTSTVVRNRRGSYSLRHRQQSSKGE